VALPPLERGRGLGSNPQARSQECPTTTAANNDSMTVRLTGRSCCDKPVVIVSNDPNARDAKVRRRTAPTPGELWELEDLLSLVLLHHEGRRDDAGELLTHSAVARDRVLATVVRGHQQCEGPASIDGPRVRARYAEGRAGRLMPAVIAELKRTRPTPGAVTRRRMHKTGAH
jgi:hypothetical protein